MTWVVALSGGMALLLTLFALGVPIFVAFVLLNVIGVFLFFGAAGFGLFANSIYATATIGALSAVPLFIVMGEILFRSGAMDVLFDSTKKKVQEIIAIGNVVIERGTDTTHSQRAIYSMDTGSVRLEGNPEITLHKGEGNILDGALRN